MAKITLTDIASGYTSYSTYNANNTLLEAAIENTLSRDGSSPNTMSAVLDMNSYNINNLPDATANQQPVTLAQAASIAGVTNPLSQETVAAVLWPATAAETLASITPTNFHYPPGNVLRYGTNTSPGVTDMSTAAQAAIDQAVEAGGSPVYFPAQEYLIGTKLTVTLTGANDEERILIYGDGQKSLITSTVVGEPTLLIPDAQFVTVRELRFEGNDLTGASGNGHAIAFTDTIPDSGTLYPQSCNVRDVVCKDFRGNDDEVTTTSTGVTTVAAGVYVGPGLGNYLERVTIDTCGIGILLDECQNTHVWGCLIETTDQYGIECDSVDDGCSIRGCDFNSCGLDGNGDPTVVSGDVNYAGVGIIGNSANQNPVTIKDSKFKVGQGVQVNAANGVSLQDCFFSVTPPDTAASVEAVRTLNIDRIVIEGCEVEYVTEGGNTNTRNGFLLDVNANHVANVVVRNCQFNHTNDVGYDVTIKGASTGSTDVALVYDGNKHGSARNGRTTATVTDCIVLTTCNVQGSIGPGNTFTAKGDGVSAGGTITDCLDYSGALVPYLAVQGNRSELYLTGGTITNTIEDYQTDTPGTFTAADATPDISWKKVWHTDSGGLTITDFDGNPVDSGPITIISEGAVVFDVTGTSLSGGTVDITTAAGDVTQWARDVDGTTWRLIGFMDQSVDNSAGA